MELFLNGKVTLLAGDCREQLKSLPDNSVDSGVMDPPYALVSIVKRFGGAAESDDTKTSERVRGRVDGYARLTAGGFMGKKWDTGETAFATEFWAEVYRVLKPGAHLAAFSGTRTYHRMAVAIEDAGFEIRDQLAWTYGSGFPKSHDISKAIDKASGAKRAKKRIDASSVGNMKARQDLRPFMIEAQKNGYHEVDSDDPASDAARQWQGWGTALKPAWEPICLARKPLSEKTVAANVLRWGTGAINVDATRIGMDGGSVTVKGDRQNTTVHAFGDGLGAQGGTIERPDGLGRFPANLIHDGSDEVAQVFPFDDSGSAARFFYSAKADGDDRLGSKHPTVKPVDLMQWLCRLITPPGGVVLDCFAGTGTTGEAAWREGLSAILMEREEEYQADIRKRMGIANQHSSARKIAKAKPIDKNPDDFFNI